MYRFVYTEKLFSNTKVFKDNETLAFESAIAVFMGDICEDDVVGSAVALAGVAVGVTAANAANGNVLDQGKAALMTIALGGIIGTPAAGASGAVVYSFWHAFVSSVVCMRVVCAWCCAGVVFHVFARVC